MLRIIIADDHTVVRRGLKQILLDEFPSAVIEEAADAELLLKKVFKEVNFVFQVNNIFNKMYESNGYTYNYISEGKFTVENYYFPMAGTNFMAAINIKL